MRQKSVPEKEPATQVVKNIRRATRRHFSAEDKIRIVLEGLRGEDSIAELCRREGIVQNLYYRWSKDFLEAATVERFFSHGGFSAIIVLIEPGEERASNCDERWGSCVNLAQRARDYTLACSSVRAR
jgi:transposase